MIKQTSPETHSADTIVKEFGRFGGSVNPRTLFTDFCQLYSLALQNCLVLPGSPVWEQNEAEYLRTIKKYDKPDSDHFGYIAAMVVNAMNNTLKKTGVYDDVLGLVFEQLDMGNDRLGQFFTPMELCTLMAQMQMRQVKEMLQSQPYVTIGEPCVGAGRQILAAANVLLTEGFNPSLHMVAECWDLDYLSVNMSYITFTLADIPAVIVHGDSISLRQINPPIRTYAWYRGGFRRVKPENEFDANTDIQPEISVTETVKPASQMLLF
jgi:hypothetical protein